MGVMCFNVFLEEIHWLKCGADFVVGLDINWWIWLTSRLTQQGLALDLLHGMKEDEVQDGLQVSNLDS